MAKKQETVMNEEGPGAGDLERHYRVTLDFRMLIREITPEVCRESFFFNWEDDAAGDPHYLEHIERQRRLYSLLRNNKEVLERYLLSVLTQEAGHLADNGLAEAFDATEESELLAPLYKGMEDEDAGFFEECQEGGVLAENTDLISTAFKVEWTGAEIAEMNRRVTGDVKRAEIVMQTKARMIKKFNTVR